MLASWIKSHRLNVGDPVKLSVDWIRHLRECYVSYQSVPLESIRGKVEGIRADGKRIVRWDGEASPCEVPAWHLAVA